MRPTKPPAIASWLLGHCAPGPRNEALAGDLLEELHGGRSAGWYRRQVFSAIIVSCLREAARQPGMLLFAMLWSMTAPAWLIYVSRLEAQYRIFRPIWRIAWPWSTISIFALGIAENMLFLWTGTMLFALTRWAASGVFDIRRISRRCLISIPIFVAVSATMLAFPMLLPSRGVFDIRRISRRCLISIPIFVAVSATMLAFPMLLPSLGRPFNPTMLTPQNEITDLRLWAILVRIPFLLTLICALWNSSSVQDSERHATTA